MKNKGAKCEFLQSRHSSLGCVVSSRPFFLFLSKPSPAILLELKIHCCFSRYWTQGEVSTPLLVTPCCSRFHFLGKKEPSSSILWSHEHYNNDTPSPHTTNNHQLLPLSLPNTQLTKKILAACLPEGASPGTTKDNPLLNLEMLSQLLNILYQRPGRVILQTSRRGRFARTALVQEDDPVH